MSTTQALPLLPLAPVPATLRELVRRVDSVPEDDVIDLLPAVFEKVQALALGDDRGAYLRHLVLLAALVNRALFGVCDVPKDADALI